LRLFNIDHCSRLPNQNCPEFSVENLWTCIASSSMFGPDHADPRSMTLGYSSAALYAIALNGISPGLDFHFH
jgi:hypothetical protein